jgi:hypothetical protein
MVYRGIDLGRSVMWCSPMSWIESVLIVSFGMVLLGPRLFHLIAGYRCPECRQARIRYVGVLHETHSGMRRWLACPRCGGRFVQRGWGKIEREPSQ